MQQLHRFWTNEKGVGTLEIIIIIAVIVLIAFAFRKWILKWVSGLFQQTDLMIDRNRDDLPYDLLP